MHAVKSIQVLLYITKNSIKHQLFVYTQWKGQTVLFQTIQFNKSTKLNGSKYCQISLTIQLSISHLFTQLNDQTFLFQTIQFSMNHLFAHSLNVKQFCLTHRLDPIRCYHSSQSGPGNNGNEGVLCIPQSSSITGASSSDCLVSYIGHSLGESYLSVEIQSVYSTASANWATHLFVCVYIYILYA